MSETEKKERINELADKTITDLNEQQKKIVDQLRKLSETVIKGKNDGGPLSLGRIMAPIAEAAKLYAAIDSYNVVLNVMKNDLTDIPPLKIVAKILGMESKDIIEVMANNADPEVWHTLIERIDVFLFANKDKAFEEENKDKEEVKEEEQDEDFFDVTISFGKKEGKNFLDTLLEDEAEDKAFILKRDKDSGYIGIFVGLKCVDEKGTVGYRCSRWKSAEYGDIYITGGTAEEKDDEEDDTN